MLEKIRLRKISALLKKGQFTTLEGYLTELSCKNPDYLLHLALFLFETRRLSKALDAAKKLVIVNDRPFTRFIYYKILKEVDPEELGRERKKLKTWFFDPLTKGKYLLYSAFIDLLEGKYNIAYRRFSECHKNGIAVGAWGKARVLMEKKNPEKALKYLKKASKHAEDFPLIYLDLGKVYGELGKKLKAVFYLKKFNKLVPINTEGHYELGMLLLEISGRVPLLGNAISRAGVKELLVKALLDSPKLENLWIYRLLSQFYSRKSDFALAARWVLVEQQVLYQLVSSIEKDLRVSQKVSHEEALDKIEALRRLLEEREVFTPEEFEKTYAEIRETRLLEEMLKLSENQNEEN